MRIGIGIDTGGTYTDAVVYDFAAAKICGTAKALTTKEDLSLGILEAIDGLPGDLVRQAESIALWKQLRKHTRVGVTFDLYDLGILFFDKSRAKQDYIVNYSHPFSL